MNDSRKWCWSRDGEIYHGEFDSIDDLIKELNLLGDAAEVRFIGRCEPIHWAIDPQQVADMLSDILTEEVGEASWDEEPDQGIISKHIEAMLNELPPPNCYKAIEVTDPKILQIFSRFVKGLAPDQAEKEE